MEEAAKKKRKIKRDAYGNIITDLNDQIPIEQQVTFELQFRLLQNCTGVYLQPDNCPAENGLDLNQLAPEQKSSSFSLSYIDHEGKRIVT